MIITITNQMNDQFRVLIIFFMHVIQNIFFSRLWLRISCLVLDSWGKIPSGLLKGSLSEFGNYDECLAIEVENDFDVDAKNMFGKFCLIEVNPPLPSPGKDRITFRKKILNYSNTDLENTVSPYTCHQIYFAMTARIQIYTKSFSSMMTGPSLCMNGIPTPCHLAYAYPRHVVL